MYIMLSCITISYLSVQPKGQLGDATGDFVKVYRFGTTVAFDYMHRHLAFVVRVIITMQLRL